MLSRIATTMIKYYRSTGGGQRWFGVDCNFEPSCSAYTLEAIELYGFRKGVGLGWNRIRRCQRSDTICKCVEPVPSATIIYGDKKDA